MEKIEREELSIVKLNWMGEAFDDSNDFLRKLR